MITFTVDTKAEAKADSMFLCCWFCRSTVATRKCRFLMEKRPKASSKPTSRIGPSKGRLLLCVAHTTTRDCCCVFVAYFLTLTFFLDMFTIEISPTESYKFMTKNQDREVWVQHIRQSVEKLIEGKKTKVDRASKSLG